MLFTRQVELFSISQLIGKRYPLQPLGTSETFYIQVINSAGFQYVNYSVKYSFSRRNCSLL